MQSFPTPVPRFVLLIATIGSAFCSEVAAAADWPQWRGPDGQGHAAAAQDLPVTWSETENIAWKTPLPGRGWSSPVIDGKQIWMTTAIETEISEEEEK